MAFPRPPHRGHSIPGSPAAQGELPGPGSGDQSPNGLDRTAAKKKALAGAKDFGRKMMAKDLHGLASKKVDVADPTVDGHTPNAGLPTDAEVPAPEHIHRASAGSDVEGMGDGALDPETLHKLLIGLGK